MRGRVFAQNLQVLKKNIFGTIYNTLPITGGEEIKYKIGPLKGSLFNNAANNLNQESQRESVIMSLISKEGLENYNIANSKKYNDKSRRTNR